MITVSEAVREFGGKWQSPKNLLVVHNDNSYEFTDFAKFTFDTILCTRGQFEAEAKRQGYVEGFEGHPDDVSFNAYNQKDPVNHPIHYTSGAIECIDAITEALGREGAAMFCRGNVIKYSWRADKKGGPEDMEKAAWYANKAAELME